MAAPEPEPALQTPYVQGLPEVNPADYLSLFEYDRRAPLDVRQSRRWREAKATWIELSYASPRGGRVPATLVIPDGKGPFPAILFMHGMPSDRESMYELASAYTLIGVAGIMIDAPFSRPENAGRPWVRGVPLSFTLQDAEDQIQLIVDLRRAVDLLQSRPELDPERLAYVGISYGGAMGGLLAGVEDRLQAYALVVGDGGLVTHVTGLDDQINHYGSPFFMLTEERQMAWLDSMWPIEPIHFVTRAQPAALLFQSGVSDAAVPPSDALRYQAAGSEPKQILWYESGHSLPLLAYLDQAKWLQQQLGPRLNWLAPNFREYASWLDRLITVWLAAGALSVILVSRQLWRRTDRPAGSKIIWAAVVLVLGPVGGLAYLVTDQATPRSPRNWREPARALGSTARFIPGTMLGMAIAVGVILLVGPLKPLDQLTWLYGLPLLTSVGLPALIRWVRARRGLRRQTVKMSVVAQVMLLNMVLAGAMPVAIIFANRLSPFGVDPVGPGLWLGLHLGAVAGALTSYPLSLWLARRGIDPCDVGSPLEPVSGQEAVLPRRLRWFQSLIGLALSCLLVVSTVVMAAAIVVDLPVQETVRLLLTGT